ncbi:MAG: winged helix-turn-helix transcriptional regulator [Clostridia bacterium]|nr:winged helix-turn-helix transcriptional regulator [Clostridia bacterium]
MSVFPFPPPEATTPAEAADNALHRFLHTHRYTMRRYFQSCGLFNGHPNMLFFLHHEPGLTQRELADRMQIAAATLSVSVRRMEAAGLVQRRPDETDARVQRLFLTEAGEAMDARCREGRQFMLSALYDGLSQQEITTLEITLQKMTANLEAASGSLPRGEGEEEAP